MLFDTNNMNLIPVQDFRQLVDGKVVSMLTASHLWQIFTASRSSGILIYNQNWRSNI